MAVHICEDALEVVTGSRAPVLFEAVIVIEGGFSQPQESVFKELCLPGHFFIDRLVLRKNLPLMFAFNIGVFSIQLLVHPDFQMAFKKTNFGGLSD